MGKNVSGHKGSKKVEFIIRIMLLVLAIGMLAWGIIYKINSDDFFKNNPKTTATVSKFEIRERYVSKRKGQPAHYVDDRIIFVEYTVDSERYETELDFIDDDMNKGDTVEIYYDKNNPTIIHTPKTLYSASTALIITGAFLLVFLIVFNLRGGPSTGNDSGNSLKETGEKIDGRFMRVEKIELGPTRVKYVVLVMINDPKTKDDRKIKSHILDFDITDYMHKDDIIPVYVNMGNTDLYYIDIDEILNKRNYYRTEI